MNSFVDSVSNQTVLTTNGENAFNSTSSEVVDLFFKIGASRGRDITTQFANAYAVDPDRALRIAQWARDARGGAGERKLFIDIVSWLSTVSEEQTNALLSKVPELGRWKDLVEIDYGQINSRNFAYKMIETALESGDGLCAKWMPRKGPFAHSLRNYLGWTPKFYRKRLVEMTKVVESQMCAKDWNEIDFAHVPSLAMARYRKAFGRNSTEFLNYTNDLADGKTKVNAGAVFPYDILKTVLRSWNHTELSKSDRDLILTQWASQPNYMDGSRILPMIDVSGSMGCPAGGSKSLTCMDVAISLGVYCAEMNKGDFKDLYLTFSENTKLCKATGDVIEKVRQIKQADWGMNTDIQRAFRTILDTSVKNEVAAEDMPETLVIFSDMQFDRCTNFSGTAYHSFKERYAEAGYEMPNVVFWNLNAHDNVPVKFNDQGVALVSGFSPSIMKAILAGKEFTPQGIMDEAIMVDRYKLAV